MKTAIIIGTQGFHTFRFDLLEDRAAVRFIGIYSQHDVRNLSAGHRRHFDEVHTVRCERDIPTAPDAFRVKLDDARRIVQDVTAAAEPGTVTIHSYGERNVLTAARLRGEFGLPGPKYEDILPFRDKCLMKERLLASRIRVPCFAAFDAEAWDRDPAAYFQQIVAEVGLPFILKPKDASSSEGVYKVGSWAQFCAVDGPLPGYEYEQFITGVMFSVNMIAKGGRCLFAEVTEYLVNSFDVQSGKVNADINLHRDDPRRARLVAFGEEAMRGLGWPDGASHLELFLTPADELVFLEVAARHKGMAGLAAMERNFGISLANLCFEVESGVASRPTDLLPVYCFDGVLPKRAGVVGQLIDPPCEGSVEVMWKVQPGDRVAATDSLQANAGTFLMSNADHAALYRDFKRLASYQPIIYREEPDSPHTAAAPSEGGDH